LNSLVTADTPLPSGGRKKESQYKGKKKSVKREY